MSTSVHPASERRVARAPGRVNLIGGQVDYHEGLVIAMAIDREVRVDVTPRADGRVVVQSAARRGTVELAADGSADPATVTPEWGRLVAGVVRALAERGRAPIGATLAVESTLTIGGGLSSSAAFDVAMALALADVAGLDLDPVDLAATAQRAEHLGTGVPCGIQDPTAAVVGGTFVLDCRSLAVRPLMLPSSVAVIVVDSGVPRTLEGSPWAQRRSESLAVARELGLTVLRDATLAQVTDRPRGRHAVSEIDRVARFADACDRDDVDLMGRLMLASHASSRDDMECSTPELDAIVAALVDAGAHGARLTGGGFGGCCVALAPAAIAGEIAERAVATYRAGVGAGRAASALLVVPAPGAAITTVVRSD